jgi:hypothetical protein
MGAAVASKSADTATGAQRSPSSRGRAAQDNRLPGPGQRGAPPYEGGLRLQRSIGSSRTWPRPDIVTERERICGPGLLWYRHRVASSSAGLPLVVQHYLTLAGVIDAHHSRTIADQLPGRAQRHGELEPFPWRIGCAVII